MWPLRCSKWSTSPYLLLAILLDLRTAEADVFTSSVKMVALAAGEADLLKAVLSSAGTPVLGDFQTIAASVNADKDPLRRFAESRQHFLNTASTAETAIHPNGAYYLLYAFVNFWKNKIEDRTELNKVLLDHQVELPSQNDLDGAIAAILRLQRVYNLTVSDMYAGNYSGFRGPELSPLSALAIGRLAFTDGFLKQSTEWLQLALNKIGQSDPQRMTPHLDETGAYTSSQRAAIVSLLGRVYVYRGDVDRAKALYHESKSLDPFCEEMRVLGQELQDQERHDQGAENIVVLQKEEIPWDMSQLCSRPKLQTVELIRPRHRCRYKSSLYLPYLCYKEEILSLQPYVSVFHEIIYDDEIEGLKQLVKGQMKPALTENKSGSGIRADRSYSRTSDIGWLYDVHPLTRKLSARVQEMTWLQVFNAWYPNGPLSSEALQVLNYGVGGHYNVHSDILKGDLPFFIQNSGTRIATFLFYLSDVDIGGYTVFPKAGISVAPVKGSALFWYNVSPAQDAEPLTLHAGCPVIKGHKWVANKWIWTYGNMYRRPCGPRPDSTQLEVEQITASRRQNFPSSR